MAVAAVERIVKKTGGWSEAEALRRLTLGVDEPAAAHDPAAGGRARGGDAVRRSRRAASTARRSPDRRRTGAEMIRVINRRRLGRTEARILERELGGAGGRVLDVAGQIGWDAECRLSRTSSPSSAARSQRPRRGARRGRAAEHVAQLTVYVTDRGGTWPTAKGWAPRTGGLGRHYPAMALVGVAAARASALVEIEGPAVVPDGTMNVRAQEFRYELDRRRRHDHARPAGAAQRAHLRDLRRAGAAFRSLDVEPEGARW